ncbi:MAG: hypothetical protein K0U98_25435 [Deltaproteobacteria bacterium]|nr:hypothetical protein [Deltaproteobacteria bacterium]
MRDLIQAAMRFPWALSLFGARQLLPIPKKTLATTVRELDAVSRAASATLEGSLSTLFEAGDALQSRWVDLALAPVPKEFSEPSGAARGQASRLPFQSTTQGPLWPPSEMADANGDFVLVGGLVLREVEPGKVAPVPNAGGLIVSKDTTPPLSAGREDFSNPLGAPYKILRELDLGPGASDEDLVLHSVSCGPFSGDFGGGQPRIPAAGTSAYNLNSSPRWTAAVSPGGAASADFNIPGHPLHRVPVLRLEDIPKEFSIGLRTDTGAVPSPAEASPNGRSDFRQRSPIRLKDYLASRGEVRLTPLAENPQGVPAQIGFDFDFHGLLPHSVYGVWALRSASLLPATAPGFALPTPLMLPNIFVADAHGRAAPSCIVNDPFPDPQHDPRGSRLQALAVTYFSSYQNHGASFTLTGTGVSAHTAMSLRFGEELRTARS